jgi:peroxiredoxin-like protein
MEAVKRYKTFTYHTSLEWKHNRQGTLSSDSKPSLDISGPPEFKGIPGVWTPEDFYVASAEMCAMTTFLSFGERKNIPLVSYHSSAEGVLEFVEGKYRFTKILVKPHIIVGKSWTEEQVEEVVHQAHDNCLIANSMATEVEILPTIELV